MYGLTNKELQDIIDVFKQFQELDGVVLFGSRAKGNYQTYSDIDLGYKGDQLTLSDLYAINSQLDDLLLPYKIDALLYKNITHQKLLEHIERVGISIYKR